MKILNVTALAGLALSMSAWADTGIECTATGKSLAVNGRRGLQPAEATFTFTESMDEEGYRALLNVNGRVETGLEGDVQYVGNFRITSISENPEYNPRKYKNSSQFKEFNALDLGDLSAREERGMWGQFILSKNTTRSRFSAHYIFQAGDHLGGTLKLTCKKISTRVLASEIVMNFAAAGLPQGIEGELPDGTPCLMKAGVSRRTGNLEISISTLGADREVLASVSIDQNEEVTVSGRGDSGAPTSEYRLVGRAEGAQSLIELTTYEDISSVDLSVSVSGLGDDTVTCSFSE